MKFSIAPLDPLLGLEAYVLAKCEKMPPYIAPEMKQRIGVWGAPSSTLDWCEENHVTSMFVAELWNTISNAWFMILAVVGLWYSRKYKLEQRYTLSYLGLLVVGVGSMSFHATLKLPMQLLDELPMLVLSAFMLFTLLEMGEARGKNTTGTYIRTSIVAAYTITVSLVYVIINDPTFHEVAYALMVLGITYLGFRNLGRIGKWRCLGFAIVSFLAYLTAFILWNIDNHFCPSLRQFRSSSASSVMGVATQLHAWWHLGAAIGTYMHLVLNSKIRMEYLGYPCVIKGFLGIPYLEVTHRRQ